MRLTSRDRLIGAIGRVRALVAVYASVLTGVTVLDVVGGIYFIFQLFHGKTDAEIEKCQANLQADAPEGTNVDFTNWACSASFKTGRVIVVVLTALHRRRRLLLRAWFWNRLAVVLEDVVHRGLQPTRAGGAKCPCDRRLS